MNFVIINKPETIDLRQVKTTNDPYNPMRLFEGVRDTFTVNTRKPIEEKKPLRNKLDGSFLVIASDLHLADSLIQRAQRANLTVSGDRTCKVGNGLGSIENIQEGNLITFGTSERFDVNWVARRGYAFENGLVPVYDIKKDWFKILDAMNEMAKEKEELAKKRADLLKQGLRPEEPVYRTMKLNLVGDAYVTEQKKKFVEQPKPTTRTVTGTMIGSSYVKVGYKVIPVKEVRIQPTYTVTFKPVVSYQVTIE